jgi:hypothetical protein
MDRERAEQLLWHGRTTVERQVVLNEGGLSASLHAEEVAVFAFAGDTTAEADTCADLELGARIDRMHAVSPATPAPARRWCDVKSAGTTSRRGSAPERSAIAEWPK